MRLMTCDSSPFEQLGLRAKGSDAGRSTRRARRLCAFRTPFTADTSPHCAKVAQAGTGLFAGQPASANRSPGANRWYRGVNCRREKGQGQNQVYGRIATSYAATSLEPPPCEVRARAI